ncbi:coenzyme F420-0:L-glutamate ligase [Knoellia locipacati]|uniref:F420-0--gamma-glutamyl ligase n=1 Tax=Knoellia locipacati TaxID=882824 RepID=A0A512SWF5_9MICO|nr:coenzyme F420-0:L-glutamate ligase [Knoellia locipacati]GEQ12278.1 F420-0--gamma-glutamyl ligase [Knoellia locipacati]
MTRALSVLPVLGLPEVESGDDLAELLAVALSADGVLAGDVVVVSSKVVSKALGLRAVGATKSDLVRGESVRVVAERTAGEHVTRVVEAVAGPVMAGAGIDASNTGPSDALLLLPRDPDACARDLRSALLARLGMPSGAPLAVVLSDTAGRPWRAGLTDFALGSAGLRVLLDHRGEVDVDGRVMSVTARAVADEVAAAADLVKGKADGVAAAVVRGLPASWFTVEGAAVDVTGESETEGVGPELAPGAAQLVRTGPGDWFAMGHVEAVRAALGVAPGSPDSEAVGIRSVGAETFADRVSRVVALTLLADEDASVDLEVTAETADRDAAAVVTLGAADDFALGRLTQRLEVAAASEDLVAALSGAPTAEHTVSARLTPAP